MQQLTGLDATFLYLESPTMPMHLGALQLLALPPGFKGRFATRLRQHVAERLAEAPVLCRRLWWPPLNMAGPAWRAAEPDLRQHIVEQRLPPAARQGDGLRELEQAVGQLHGQLLDRERPLWKFTVLEGLAPGADGRRRVALYTQLHHAAADGPATAALADLLLDKLPQASAGVQRARRRSAGFEPGMSEMLRGALAHQAQMVAGVIRELPAHVGTLGTLGRSAGRAAGDAVELALEQTLTRLGLAQAGASTARERLAGLALAPRTAFNRSLGPERVFATARISRAELQGLAEVHGLRLEQAVWWLCSGALRRYLLKRRSLPKRSLLAAVPTAPPAGKPRQAVPSLQLLALGTELADPFQRLAVLRCTGKATAQALPADFPSLGLPWLMEAAASLYGKARVAERVPQLANLIISQVPGPQQPLYLAGAQLLGHWPASVVVHGLALNVTVQHYDEHLEFGLVADAKAVPTLHELADAIAVAFEDLLALPLPGEAGHPQTRAGKGLAARAGTLVLGAVAGGVGRLAGAAAQAAWRQALQPPAPSARPGRKPARKVSR